jgi:aldose 1-epimerase
MADITSAEWGETEGKKVQLFSLVNDAGILIKVTNYGAIMTEMHIPDSAGELSDVVLGFDSLAGYLKGHPFFGATAGRVANRIAKGTFKLGGKTYKLAINNGPNHLHGGVKGFDKQVWTVKESKGENTEAHVTFEYISKDGDEGYPGKLTATVTYTLTDTNQLKVTMTATTEATTIVNLAHHSYFNLAGHNSGNVLKQELQLFCDNYTPVDATAIPTGVIKPVTNTPFDFRKAKAIGKDIAKLPAKGKDNPGGFDHNLVVNGKPGTLRKVAIAAEPTSGRSFELWASEPGVQFYTGNFLDGTVTGKDGTVYKKHAGFCLETQKYPDAIHHEGQAGWPSVILKPGQTYRHDMVYKIKVTEG